MRYVYCLVCIEKRGKINYKKQNKTKKPCCMLSALFFKVLGCLCFQIHPPYSRAGCTSPFQPLLSRNQMAPQGPNCPFGFRTNNYSLYILVQIISDIYELGFTKPEYMKYNLFL